MILSVCYTLLYFALIKKISVLPVFIFHIKLILSPAMTGMPPGKTDGFSWYTVHATQPAERFNFIYVIIYQNSSKHKHIYIKWTIDAS